MDEVYTYEINEINTNNLNNSYVSLQSPIKLEVHKKSADNKYSIDYIVLCQGQENKSEEKTNVNLQVKLADGTPVTVNAKVQNDEIIVTIPNKIINGNYSIKLTKSTNNFAKKLKGVVFTHNNSALGEKTDSNGEIVIENNYKITKDNVNTEDTYTITEVEDKQNNVLELASPINITVGKTTDNTIGKYVVDTVKISCGNVTKQLSRNSENRVVLENLPTVKEGKLTKINVTLNKETQEIIINVDNPEVDGKYSLNLRKVCSGVDVEGVVFKVNGTNLSATNASGITKCEENKTITSSTLQSDVYTVEEISIDTNKYIKLAKPVTLTVNKGLDADGKNYIVTGMKLEGTGKNSTTIFKQGVNSVSLSGVILENGLNSDLKNTPTVTVKATYDGNVITVEIPNKEIQGIYSLKIKKVDEENTPISNIYFEGSSIINKATDTFTTEPTNAEGITNVKTVKLTKENYTTTDTFTINEVNIDNSYIKLQSPIALDVNKYIKDNKYVVKEIVLYQDENKTTAGNNVELDNVKLADNSIVKITASVENNVITVTIPNKTVTGKYSMDVVKTTEDYTTTIPGMTFKRIYKDKIKVVTTDDEGVANLVKEFEINKNNLNTIDEYEITEVENVTNEFLELQNAITVKVQKTNDSGEYVVNKVTVTSGNSKGEITRAGDKNCTELANLPTVNPDVKTKVKVTLDKNTQKITVYVQNPPISGKYGLNLRKVCGEKGISGVIFKVNGEKLEATDEDGMVKYLKNQPITDITNEDTYTVEEISVDTNKYIKLAKPVTLKVQKGLDTDGKKYIATGIKLEGTGITNVETGETGIVSQQGQLVSEGKIGVKLNVILENKAEATLQAILDVNSQTITFKIKNELIRGIYALRIRKVDTNNNTPVENVTFNISAKINEKNKTIKTNATNNEGIVNIGRVTLANETLDKADVYEINEINADNSYIKLKNPIYLQVNKCINNYKYCIKDIGLYKIKDGKPDTTGNNVKLENVELKDGTKVEVTATVEDNIITITIPNKPVEGEYNINIQKYDENFTNRLANTKFEYSINNETPKQEVTSEVIDENNGGEISLPKYKITRENVGITDKYVITEIETPSKTYLKLAEPLELNVTKEIIEGVYVIKDITLKNSTESVTLSKETNENSVTLHNIKTVDNNRTANAIVTINRSTQTITIKIENQKIRGSYDLEITKLEELLGTPLQGAKFVIEAYTQKGEQIKLYKNTDDVNSMESIIPGKFTIKNEDGKFSIKDIRIEKPETYILKITEIETPETYTKLRDTIELKVTTKLYEETEKAKYVLDNIELISGENDGLVKLVKNTEDKIELEVTNNQFDLALRKYISSINGEDISRWTKPEVDTSKLITGEETTAEYYNAKAPLRIYKEQEVIYTLRIYNEGQIDGYATEITDYLPEQLEFLPEDEFNTSRGWKYDEQDETLRTIKTNYLSKENGKEEKNADGEKSENSNLIKAFNSKTGEIDYVEVQVKCKVKPNAVAKQLITNIAEITKYEGENRPEVVDRDSKKTAEIPADRDLPSYKQNEIEKPYVPGQEDDDDFEKLVVEEFDLSLRKFITKVNGKTLEGENSREPVVDTSKLVSGEETTAKYTHTKEPIEVAYKNVVEYTIRVFNEGTVDGYANIVKDDIPDGLVFVPEDETNKQYGWRMLDKDGKETTNAKKAEYIVTEYLSMENGRSINNVSKEDMQENNETSKVVSEEETVEYEDVKNANVIKAFDASKMETLDYKDVKAVFKVDVPDKKDNIIINKAQISEDTDEYGKPVKDKDSTTDVWIEGEDDQDREYLKLVYFDLALRKWVSQAIVYENGVEKVTQTGHTGYENPEPVVKVDLGKNILDKVVVKFKYQIKVTNEGIVPGYVKEISDYIPEGLRFEQSDNPTWEEKDGKVVTSEVENVLLQPGESVTVGIVLTWNNAKDNLGLKINIAEISKDYNEYGDTPDIDSTPDNKTAGEDDIDTAPVMLAVRTGDVNVPVMIIILSMCYIAVCAVAIKRVFYKKK